MSYRLDQRDEADVRYWLGDDIRGDVGVKSDSGSSGWETRSIYLPIENHRPYRRDGTDDVGLRCGPILVKPKKPPFVARETGAALVRLSERDDLLERIWAQLHPSTATTIELCYSGAPIPKGFEPFGDVGPLLYDTDQAVVCERRESDAAGERVTRLDALMRLGFRLMQKGIEIPEHDLDLRVEMELAADGRLSRACREYTRIADHAYAVKKAKARK